MCVVIPIGYFSLPLFIPLSPTEVNSYHEYQNSALCNCDCMSVTYLQVIITIIQHHKDIQIVCFC